MYALKYYLYVLFNLPTFYFCYFWLYFDIFEFCALWWWWGGGRGLRCHTPTRDTHSSTHGNSRNARTPRDRNDHPNTFACAVACAPSPVPGPRAACRDRMRDAELRPFRNFAGRRLPPQNLTCNDLVCLSMSCTVVWVHKPYVCGLEKPVGWTTLTRRRSLRDGWTDGPPRKLVSKRT